MMRKVLLSILTGFVLSSTFTAASSASSVSLEDTRKEIFEGIGTCDLAIFTNDDYLAVSLMPLVPGVGHVRVYSLKDSKKVFDISTSARVTDIKIVGDTAYVLTGISIEAWSISSEKQIFHYASHPQAVRGLNWRKQAQGFILSGNRAIIAHAVLGVSVVDLSTGEFVKILPMPTVSAALDIALVNSSQAVLAIDNDDEGAFRGMYLMNLATLEFSKKIKVDNAIPQSVRLLDGNRLMLSYSNAIWKFGKKEALAATKEPKPSRRAWQLPGLSVVDMQGKVAFDRKYVYGCFKMWDTNASSVPNKPMAFDLKALQLD